MTEQTAELPPHLAERTRALNTAAIRRGQFILYWMHHAMRVEENPALDAALILAARHRLPVLVYQGLAGRHPYNSDRHHLFILQGARDVAHELAARGIRYLFHLPQRRDSPSPLPRLCESAAAIVVEEMPVPPFDRWQPRLAARADCSVWAIDTRCLVPMQQLDGPFDRAYRFRKAVEEAYESRVGSPWPDDTPASTGLATAGIEGLMDLPARDDRDLLSLIARCDVDHSVWPIFHTSGGSDAAVARWRRFRERGLAGYHRQRNDAAVEPPAGVSRLSAYLHYGQISPFRLAREAAAFGGQGAAKFLDELLVWRELAHNFCFHHRDLESLGALPNWARKTLAAHAGDTRPQQLEWESLARGRSGDALWDAAQHSLLRHGELHNNLRMTWAKAIPFWTPDPATALETLIDLNHRFALDGSDPNSYGGLLWALGRFDRPFEPETPVLGSVRARSTKSHARRLDLETYRRRIDRPPGNRKAHIAIIGAGISGLTAARILSDAGHVITVFEKSRGPGGRTATRRVDTLRFDHGAQYFSVRHPDFRRYVESWEQAGLLRRWPRRLVRLDPHGRPTAMEPAERWVAIPGMNAVTKHLARDVQVRFDSRIEAIAPVAEKWSLRGDESNGRYDAILLSMPAPQAAALIGRISPALQQRVAAVRFIPCWAVMGRSDSRRDTGFDAAFVDDPVLAWIAADHSKPARDGASTWVLHATGSWSEANLEVSGASVIRTLCDRARELCGIDLDIPAAIVHRWRFARVADPLDEHVLLDETLRLAVCGDWCTGDSRVENAWLSGTAAAARLLAMTSVERGAARR